MHISSNSCRGYTRSQTTYVSKDYGLLTTVDKTIGHAKDWVQLCGKKRYKVTSYSCIREWEGIGILSVWSKRGGCLPCWRGSGSGSSTKGVPSGSGCTSIEQTIKQRINIIAMVKHMINIVVVMFMVTTCCQFHLKESICKVIFKCTSNLNSN